jgi:hypothetical protein
MDRRGLFEIWAPPRGRWSPWAKPVLFAHLDAATELPRIDMPEVRFPIDRTKAASTALVVDLRGFESISLGLELARLGYRPIPLFNACPRPAGYRDEDMPEAVPATLLLLALVQAADRLKSIDLPEDAPPAFLLDANRLAEGKPIDEGWFDNRWVVFATDLPSARFLVQHQITAVELIHRGAAGEDVVDVLRTWNRSGIPLWHTDLNHPGPPRPLVLPAAWFLDLSRFARRLWAQFNLRRNPGGGYGGLVPESESSGG